MGEMEANGAYKEDGCPPTPLTPSMPSQWLCSSPLLPILISPPSFTGSDTSTLCHAGAPSFTGYATTTLCHASAPSFTVYATSAPYLLPSSSRSKKLPQVCLPKLSATRSMGKGFSWSQFWEKDGAEDSLWRHLTGADTDAAYLILVTNAANGVCGNFF